MGRPVQQREDYFEESGVVARMLRAVRGDARRNEQWKRETEDAGRKFIQLLNDATKPEHGVVGTQRNHS